MITGALGIMLAAAVATQGPGQGCRVEAIEGVRPTPQEVGAVRSSCEDARRRFSELFGEAAPSARVIFWDRPGYRTALDADGAVVFWPREGAPVQGAAPDDRDPAVLPHEIAHVLLAARYRTANARAANSRESGYGTPLPDWFEEGVAIWAEPAAQRDERIHRARALPAEYLDLPAILRGRHPAVANPALFSLRDGSTPPADRALQAFYRQAAAVLSFLFEVGGPDAVRQVAARYAAAPDDPRAILGAPGVPRDQPALIRAWEAWLASD